MVGANKVVSRRKIVVLSWCWEGEVPVLCCYLLDLLVLNFINIVDLDPIFCFSVRLAKDVNSLN